MSASLRPPLEHRGLAQAPRVDTSGRLPALVGYAIRFDAPSAPLGTPPFIEVVRREALARLHERRDVKALVAHDPSRVVGSSKAGTLALAVDASGLRFRLDPPDSPIGHDLVEAVRRGDLDGVSIGFVVRAGGETWQRAARPPVRELRDVDVFELSFVSWPAYEAAGVAIEQRALDEARAIIAAGRQADRYQQLRQLQRRVADAVGQPSLTPPVAAVVNPFAQQASDLLADARALVAQVLADGRALSPADDAALAALLARIRAAIAASSDFTNAAQTVKGFVAHGAAVARDPRGAGLP